MLDQARISQYAEEHDLELVILFGSQARGAAHEGSDLDLALMPRRWDGPGSRLEATMSMSRCLGRGDLDVTWFSGTFWFTPMRR